MESKNKNSIRAEVLFRNEMQRTIFEGMLKSHNLGNIDVLSTPWIKFIFNIWRFSFQLTDFLYKYENMDGKLLDLNRLFSNNDVGVQPVNFTDLNKEMKCHHCAHSVWLLPNTLGWAMNMCHLILGIICTALWEKWLQIWEWNERMEGPPEVILHIFTCTQNKTVLFCGLASLVLNRK